MKDLFITLFLVLTFTSPISAIAQDDGGAKTPVDYFKSFTGSYHVLNRSCAQNDEACNAIDSIEIVSTAGDIFHLHENSNGKTLQDTELKVYGDESLDIKYARLYGRPDLVGWIETIKNEAHKVIEQDSIGLEKDLNTDPNGPVLIYTLGKRRKIIDPSTGEIKNKLMVFQLTRDQ